MTELGVVRRSITRADRACVDALAAFGVATVHEAMGRIGLMKPYLRPIYPGAQVSRTAVTVLLQPGDNWMLHVAAEQLQGGRRRRRSHLQLQRRLFRRPARHRLQGARCAGGDRRRRRRRRRRAAASAERTLAAARAREGNEGDKRAKLASGVLGLDIYKMREPLEKAGLKYID